MSFNFKSQGERSYRSWKKWTSGDVLIGKFTSQTEDQFGNPSYSVEVIETDFDDEEANLEAGKVLGLNSCGSLNHKMEEVLLGSVIRVEYEGKDVIDNAKSPMNGKEFHKVALGVDDSTAHSTAKVEQEVENDENLDL